MEQIAGPSPDAPTPHGSLLRCPVPSCGQVVEVLWRCLVRVGGETCGFVGCEACMRRHMGGPLSRLTRPMNRHDEAMWRHILSELCSCIEPGDLREGKEADDD